MSALQPPTPIDVGGCKDHDGGVNFAREFTVGELVLVKPLPCLCLTDKWGPLTAGSLVSASVVLGFVYFFSRILC